jgi:4-hydroxybenzoate polyprenyltransferase
MVPALIRLARPTHWVKNGFVAAPLLFANPASLGEAVVQSATAVAVFSLMASAIYCFNDVLDAESDRAHPTKRARPIAAGLISPELGVAWGCTLAAGAIALSWFKLPLAVLAVLGAYVVNNVLYNGRVKTVAIADVISIATGFVLRLVAGAIAIGVVASSWLLVCSFSLALFLGFGKRRSELALAEQGRVYRPVLRAYTPSTLDSAMGISATLTLMCYMLYTIAPETREAHGTGNLIYTVPPVFYAMFRFIFKVQDARGESPEELLLRDRVMLLTAGAWVGLVLLVLKFRVVTEAFAGK